MPRPPRPSALYLVIGGVSWPVLRILYRLRSTGRENVPDGGCVLAANHWSNFDPWPLGIPLYPRRFLRFMAKKELFWPPLGWLVRGGGGFRVDRGTRDQEAIDTAVDLCRAGHVVVMFPEGTRRAKGLRKRHAPRWHTGAARIALDAGVPLVPAGIGGTDRLRSLGPLRVAYGPPIPLDDLAGREPGEAAQLATERLREAITELERVVGSGPTAALERPADSGPSPGLEGSVDSTPCAGLEAAAGSGPSPGLEGAAGSGPSPGLEGAAGSGPSPGLDGAADSTKSAGDRR